MSLATYIDSLREKPIHVRKRYAFWTSFGVTAAIFVFWLSSFSATGPAVQGSVAKAVEKVSTPGHSLVAGVGDFATDIWSMIVGPKKVEYSTIEVRPGK